MLHVDRIEILLHPRKLETSVVLVNHWLMSNVRQENGM